MVEAPRKPAIERPSRETMNAFRHIAAGLIEEKVQELGGKEILGHMNSDDMDDAINSLGMTPANDKMQEGDMRDLLALGNSIANAAMLIVRRYSGEK